MARSISAAPAPRKDGKPDFSGIWLTGNPLPCDKSTGSDFLECGAELPASREVFDIGSSLPEGLPFQPWALELVQKRTRDQSKDDPHARCLPDTFARAYGLPHMQKFIQVAGLLVMLDEMNANYRQVFTDGRPLPVDPTPAWNGYSSAHVAGRHAGDPVDWLPRRSRGSTSAAASITDAAKMTETDPPARLRPPRDRAHRRRPEGVHEAVDRQR